MAKYIDAEEDISGTNVENSGFISIQEALDAVEESRRLNHHKNAKEACVHEYEHRHFLKILMDIQPADVAKIVRCKHCKYHSYDDEFCCYWCNHEYMAREVKPDFYCGYGEE